jgi:hypothetical protein
MLREKESKPGILRGLQSDNIICLPEIQNDHEDATEEYSTLRLVNSRRRTTRQDIYGRQDALYDTKYHPMDDVVRPSSARRHRSHRSQLSHNVIHDSDSEEEQSMSHISSGPEKEDDDDDGEERSGSKRKRCREGIRRSKRPITQIPVNYNTQHHPQDDILRTVDSDIIPTRNARRKKKHSTRSIVIHEDSTREEVGVSRSAIRRPKSNFEMSNSVSSLADIIDDSDRFLDEIYGAPEIGSEHPCGDSTDNSLMINASDLQEEVSTVHLPPQRELLVSGDKGCRPQLPRSSLVSYPDSDDATDEEKEEEAKSENRMHQEKINTLR